MALWIRRFLKATPTATEWTFRAHTPRESAACNGAEQPAEMKLVQTVKSTLHQWT
jgi:hypothetical protein